MSDALASSHLTAAAAFVVATYSHAFGHSFNEKIAIAVGMISWYFGVTFLAETLAVERLVAGIPLIGANVGIPILILTTPLPFPPSSSFNLFASSDISSSSSTKTIDFPLPLLPSLVGETSSPASPPSQPPTSPTSIPNKATLRSSSSTPSASSISSPP